MIDLKLEETNIKKYGLRTIMALCNYFKSSVKVYPHVFEELSIHTKGYMGVKNVPSITQDLIEFLQEQGFLLHTMDKSSLGGRAIDMDLINPITGNAMTGSSSGTAINVFLGINDVGVGTDGGGSVLAPAMSLNLFSVIHPEFNRFSKEKQKMSTDNILFTPTIGFISKRLSFLDEVMDIFGLKKFPEDSMLSTIRIATDSNIKFYIDGAEITQLDLSYKNQLSREELIQALNHLVSGYDLVISKEGPIDVFGKGDSIFGHFDTETRRVQAQSNKGFLRVVNMCGLIGLTVPCRELATGYLLICSPQNKRAVSSLIHIAEKIYEGEDELLSRYFENYNNYWIDGINL